MKPDEYYNNSLFELVRFGRHTIMNNLMGKNQHEKFLKKLEKTYPRQKEKIDKLVHSIRKRVVKCDPIQLLTFSSDMFLCSNLGIYSEIESSQKDIYISRMTEYIQSIFVSSPLKHKPSKRDPSRHFFKLQRDIIKLYELIHFFYLSWGASAYKIYPNYDEKIRDAVVESQFLYTVRGHRYQVFELEYFERLLKEHNDIFVNLFGISYQEILTGIKKLQYALSQGKLDELNNLGELMQDFYENTDGDIEKFKNKYPNAGESFRENFLGTGLRNVISITGWPEEFVRILSWGINQNKEFFDEQEFAGWPIIDLPIQKRPFIKIDNDYYCFDYYSFVDNFYRALQKAISRVMPEYPWSDFQKTASENMVAEIFSQILPGCVIHQDNYYPKNKSLKKLNENDIIIIFEKIIIIVEVKAGSFVFTAPISDFDNHIISYKNLIEKADHQCKRTYDYLTSNTHAVLYNADSSKKTEINMNEIEDIYMISVTVDNINDFAARAEKVNFLQLQCNAISLSIDDLMVYRSYFDSPLTFLHFLSQRRQATNEERLALNDELDHLGLYIKHNMYCIQLMDYPDDAQIRFHGYREELDKYFTSLYHPQLHQEKPTQKLPVLFSEIISYLDNNKVNNKVYASNYLLSFSSEAKEHLCQCIEYTLIRQEQLGNMISFNTAGNDAFSLRYTAFVEQPDISLFTDEYKRDYVLSTMLWNQENRREMLTFRFGINKKFLGVELKSCLIGEITEEEKENLLNLAKSRARIRLDSYLKQYKSIDDTELCPCGSGKTFGECCHLNLGN